MVSMWAREINLLNPSITYIGGFFYWDEFLPGDFCMPIERKLIILIDVVEIILQILLI